MASALILDESVKRQIQHLKEYANTHRLNIATLKWMFKHKKVIGDDLHYAVNIPIGYRAVFTIEQQPEPMGWCRHISISLAKQGHGPSVYAVAELLKEFGFTETPGQSIIAVYRGGHPVNTLPPTWAMYLEGDGVVNIVEKL